MLPCGGGWQMLGCRGESRSMRHMSGASFGAIFAFGLTLQASNLSDDFYEAIRRDDVPAVEKLVKANGSNVVDNHGSTPLMYAAAIGSESMMRRLLDMGADPKLKNSFDASALHWCG